MNAFWKVIGLRLGPGLLIGLLVLLGLGRVVGATLAVDPRGQLVFVGERDVRTVATALSYRGYWSRLSNIDVFRLDPAAAEPINLTHDPAADHHPTLSPDGTLIAFQSDRGGNWDLYLTDLRGSPAINLTHRPANDTLPAWSPDGTRIAFISFDTTNTPALNLLTLVGGQIQRLSPPELLVDTLPAWSPDGKWIAGTATQFNGQLTTDVFVIEASTGALITLGTHTGILGKLTWAPDGSQAAYTVLEEGLLYAAGIGIPPYPLTTRDGGGLWETFRYQDLRPAWSPQGDQIAFQAYVDIQAGYDVFTIQATGSAPRNLTHRARNDVNPAWSPDGSQIAFQSWWEDSAEVYVVDAAGGDPHRLTHTANDNWEPLWLPDPP